MQCLKGTQWQGVEESLRCIRDAYIKIQDGTLVLCDCLDHILCQ